MPGWKTRQNSENSKAMCLDLGDCAGGSVAACQGQTKPQEKMGMVVSKHQRESSTGEWGRDP